MRKNLPIGCIVIDDQHPQLFETYHLRLMDNSALKLFAESRGEPES